MHEQVELIYFSGVERIWVREEMHNEILKTFL